MRKQFVVHSKWFIFFYSLLTTHSLLLTPVFAVEVEPMRIEQTISLSEPAQAALTVTNPLRQPVGVQVSAGPYRAFQADQKILSAERWLHFEPARFTLAAGASTTVQVRIEPPPAIANDTAGEYLAAIVIDQLPAEEPPVHPEQADHPSTEAQGDRRVEGTARLSIVPRLALPVYLQIKGREKIDVQLSDVSLKITRELAQNESGELAPELFRIDTSLKNAGTVHVRLNGTFALFEENGRLVQSGPLGKTLPILPSSTLVLPTLFPLPEPGRYKLALTVENGPDLLQKEIPFEITGNGQIIENRK